MMFISFDSLAAVPPRSLLICLLFWLDGYARFYTIRDHIIKDMISDAYSVVYIGNHGSYVCEGLRQYAHVQIAVK